MAEQLFYIDRPDKLCKKYDCPVMQVARRLRDSSQTLTSARELCNEGGLEISTEIADAIESPLHSGLARMHGTVAECYAKPGARLKGKACGSILLTDTDIRDISLSAAVTFKVSGTKGKN